MSSSLPTTASGHVEELTPKQFVNLSQRPTLIDVRTPLEYASGHASGALNLSLDRILLGMIPWIRRWIWPQWFQDLAKDQPVAVMCLTSHRSPIAAQQLIKMGFARVINISGGMMQWQKSGLRVQKG